eukprot:TRINITY_DN4893_c1_g1_i4.p1 TRINITY_DN4893_c1_g1~~TRINITY_DN4893_c1_g1_i4.p1  ORF type:complete len:108 (+),score=0.88 TRINITY_DN4893_c1_g1_i4:259-582(+)
MEFQYLGIHGKVGSHNVRRLVVKDIRGWPWTSFSISYYHQLVNFSESRIFIKCTLSVAICVCNCVGYLICEDFFETHSLDLHQYCCMCCSFTPFIYTGRIGLSYSPL